jgi:hypothetical protein
MLKNNSSCGYIQDKSGNGVYFYLSPYLNWELKFKTYCTLQLI